MRLLIAILFLLPCMQSNAQQVLVFTHDTYSAFEFKLQKPGVNFHTGVKPYFQSEVLAEVALDKIEEDKLFSVRNTFAKYLFTKHFIQVDKPDFKFTVDPVIDWAGGYEKELTIVNTRGFWVRGKIGEKLSFQSTFFETQARFASYVNNWIDANNVIPGQGKYKLLEANEYLGELYDYQWSGGYVNYQASKFFNIQFGQGKNFFGDGYRSLMLSDNSFNYPFLKITTTVWNIKYVNLYSVYSDIRQEVRQGLLHPKKYSSSHFLSWNLGKRLNINAFETVVWDDTLETRGFDVSYMNPIIFLRPIDFSLGSPDNVLLGGGVKFKLTKTAHLYGQLVLDEFRFKEIFAGDGWWANKFATQIGFKIYNAMDIEGLYLQAEYNSVRPFTYSHRYVTQNYAHYNHTLAHPLGSNFRELLFIGRYTKGRWNYQTQWMYAQKGLDSDSTNFGGDVYKSYSTREGDYGNEIGQGDGVKIYFLKAAISYTVNPRYNLQLEVGATFRKQSSDLAELDLPLSTYVHFGLRTNILNRYFDF
ncbi:MAG: hypothetical protein ACI8P7_000931 [Candidatus Azotimanducaceae bacterium]|jgi:hypothetical protein